MATLRNKRNSLPSLSKFFVSKRASIFECHDETSHEKREKSPCGVLEVSERKLEARKNTKNNMARRKRQIDPYAEDSTELEDNDVGIDVKPCCHANRAVNLSNIKKNFKNGTAIGACAVCSRARMPIGFLSEIGNERENAYSPVIWMCTFCGHQGCDRKHHKHSLHHYLTPRSDPHFLAINTREWTVWCYKCNNEVLTTSCKKLDDCLHYMKKVNETTPRSAASTLLAPVKTNLISQYSGSDSRLHLSSLSEESFRSKKLAHNSIHVESFPKARGLVNLGNTCFFNSVMQNLSQTHFLSQLLGIHLQSGKKMQLPGRYKEKREHINSVTCNSNVQSSVDENNIELDPLELHLSEGGALSLSFSSFIKDMNSVSKHNNVIKPEQLFGLLCKKSTQYAVLEQQDAHELLRCFLDGIRNEEIHRMNISILKAFALPEKTDLFTLSEKLNNMIHGYEKQTTHTIIDEIFSGQLISTVICEQCRWYSQTFEPFMDLSLPIIEEKGKPKKNTFVEDEHQAERSSRTVGRKIENISKHQAKKQKNSKKLETSDADVEDNNDSDYVNGKFKSTKRQPSIVVEETLCNLENGICNDPPLDYRLLSSCPSYDVLCSSLSDTERYYTAAGGDTMDELDSSLIPDNASIKSGPSSGTSGKGDSLSISSSEAVDQCGDKKCKVVFENNNLDDIIFKVNDMKIISGSNDSLLDVYNYADERLGSADSFQSFDDHENKNKIKTREHWMAKSVTTLAPRYQTDRQECSIMSCLTSFSSPELLIGSNKITCENCTRIQVEKFGVEGSKSFMSSASKQLLILSPPAVLTLQLKRFQHVGRNLQKINRYVEFPLILDLAPFVSSMSVGLNNLKQKQSQVVYALYGIVQHSGRLDNGHYVAYVRSRPMDPTRLTKRFLNQQCNNEYDADKLIEQMIRKEETSKKARQEPFKQLDIQKVTEDVKMGKWYFVSDTHVSPVNIEKVMKAQAYLLFYERIL